MYLPVPPCCAKSKALTLLSIYVLAAVDVGAVLPPVAKSEAKSTATAAT